MCPGKYTTLQSTSIIAEKPFITIDDDGRYTLNVPQIENDKIGPSDFDNAKIKHIDFNKVYVS